MKNIERVTLFELTWNTWNGFHVDILHISNGYMFNKSLFSINTDFNRFLILDLFFVELTIWDNTP